MCVCVWFEESIATGTSGLPNVNVCVCDYRLSLSLSPVLTQIQVGIGRTWKKTHLGSKATKVRICMYVHNCTCNMYSTCTVHIYSHTHTHTPSQHPLQYIECDMQ